MPRRALLLVPLAALAAALSLWPRPAAAEADPAAGDEAGFARVVLPFLRRHCFDCHGRGEREGDLALDGFADRAAVLRAKRAWTGVLERLHAGDMPPEDRPRPSADEVKAVIAWVRGALGAAAPAAGPFDPGRVTLRRLNRAEYDHTVQDMLRVDLAPARAFPDDDVGYGFDTIGDVLAIPPLLLEKYLAAGEAVARAAFLDFEPVRERVSVESARREGSDGNFRDGFGTLWSNGAYVARVRAPYAGEYVVRARAYGMQAGPDPARMALRVDGRALETFDVRATDAAPEVFEVRARLSAGDHDLAAAFVNDFYDPGASDPAQRDRNLAVAWLELEGPLEAPPLPWAHRTYLTKRPADNARPVQRRAVAREVLGPLVTRAFRRPAKADELERYAKLVDQAMTDGASFERGMQLALTAVLCSPHFLFRFELDAARPRPGEPAHPGAQPLADHELATRLSYYLHVSLPDDELVRAAQAGGLRDQLEAQARRLLADPKAGRFVQQFATQWLQLRRLDTAAPDTAAFPGFDEPLRAAMKEESARLFEAVLRGNRPVSELLDAPYTFVNERLARHYGIRGVRGPEFVRVDAPPVRKGLLGHASVLTATSNPTRTSPVKRGRWVLEVLLDDPPPPPLPGMDSLKEDGPATGKTLRARLERHRADPACAGCHARLDPLGFGLERFDAVGAWRDQDEGLPIDDTGTLPGGLRFEGVDGLRGYLRGRSRDLARALAKKLMVYGLGRGPVAADEGALDALLDALGPDPGLADLVVGVTRLDAFQKRRAAKGGR
ncbi:MAG: DUF1592 domain-containing protein [Planctomycetes bacterium]|nr:DUF1592 domain-containing protein [Planctomycetota bacterium]